MHTPLCRHAVGEPAEYVAAAEAAGVDEICFTCHCPMPDWFDQAPRMRRSELPEYVAMVRAVQDRGPVSVRLGIEADYFPGTEEYVRAMLQEYPFDFVLGSVHILCPDYQRRLQETGATSTAAVVELYFDELAAAARTGLFDSISHPDLVKRRAGMDPHEHEPVIRRALAAIRDADVCLEINTSGLRKYVFEPYPSAPIIRWAAEEGVRFSFGSDSHAPEDVGHAWEEIRRQLLSLGVPEVHRFEQRRRIPVSLE
jgi:histidinol-phosphatase (PHP family)